VFVVVDICDACIKMTRDMNGERYTTGQQVAASGIYTVVHRQHRLPHEVTLLKGETFPRCAKCGDLVEYVLSQAASIQHSAAFQSVRVYALPDLDDEPKPNALRLGLSHV
jgi:hypothetical protein